MVGSFQDVLKATEFDAGDFLYFGDQMTGDVVAPKLAGNFLLLFEREILLTQNVEVFLIFIFRFCLNEKN